MFLDKQLLNFKFWRLYKTSRLCILFQTPISALCMGCYDIPIHTPKNTETIFETGSPGKLVC